MRAFGKFILFMRSLFVKRESFKTYFKLVMDESMSIGVDSIIIVVIVSTFIGAVTAVQTAYNLVSPLIPDHIISLIVRDMTLLELAPTITALVYAGKVGSSSSSVMSPINARVKR